MEKAVSSNLLALIWYMEYAKISAIDFHIVEDGHPRSCVGNIRTHLVDYKIPHKRIFAGMSLPVKRKIMAETH